MQNPRRSSRRLASNHSLDFDESSSNVQNLGSVNKKRSSRGRKRGDVHREVEVDELEAHNLAPDVEDQLLMNANIKNKKKIILLKRKTNLSSTNVDSSSYLDFLLNRVHQINQILSDMNTLEETVQEIVAERDKIIKRIRIITNDPKILEKISDIPIQPSVIDEHMNVDNSSNKHIYDEILDAQSDDQEESYLESPVSKRSKTINNSIDTLEGFKILSSINIKPVDLTETNIFDFFDSIEKELSLYNLNKDLYGFKLMQKALSSKSEEYRFVVKAANEPEHSRWTWPELKQNFFQKFKPADMKITAIDEIRSFMFKPN